jgi:hypothetical protein
MPKSIQFMYPRFPNIDYSYWCEKNEYFADIPLTKTIKMGLDHSRKGGLIAPVLETHHILTNKNLVELIKLKINMYQSIDCFNSNELLLIFDLIQGWGGKMGRNIYVKPKGNPTRNSLTTLAEIYREAIDYCVSGKYQLALQKITSIPNLGESFATKHIFFWSESKGKALPIYDTRIKTLLFFKSIAAATYDVYVKSLHDKAEDLKLGSVLIERALFSFSQNYFPNNSLFIKKNISDRNNIDEAKTLNDLYVGTLNRRSKTRPSNR